ncbi:MAG: histidine kinase [Burkholderiales bacterium]
MFRAISNAVYRTPWWAMGLGGLFVILLLALFTVPFNVLRLTESGKSQAESQAIQREIDYTFGDSALGIAERVVSAMGQRTSDPARKSELEKALKDIAEARRDMFNAEREATRAIGDAKRDVAREASRAAKEAANAARSTARDAAISARDLAKERIEELRTARREAVDLQSRVGLKDAAALEPFDKAIKAAEENERAAEEALKQLKDKQLQFSLGMGADGIKFMGNVPKETLVPAVPAPSKADKAAVAPPASDALNLEGGNKDKRARGVIYVGPDNRQVITIDVSGEVGAEKPSLPLLPAELREDIRRKVTSDFRRMGIGSALIVTFIPLFIMLLIAKFYIGRSRRALEVANLKTKEAESANVNRQIVEAKLMALQAQVEPHFLYNTLANVQALTEVDPQKANEMTGHLIQYLRASLPKMRENISTVGQEIELVRAYLNILKMRMGARLEFGIDVPEDLLVLPFPPLMLPSLVENAIKHGLEPQREGGRVDVLAERVGTGDDAMIRLIVKDTGRGFSDAPVQAGSGVGLANVRERLVALFSGRAHLTLEANAPKGCIATIEAPAKGSAPFSTTATAPAEKTIHRTWRSKILHFAARTHSFWANLLVKAFGFIVALLGVMFIIGIIGLASGLLPMTIGDTPISGIEGMALGTIALLLAFGALSIAALVVLAVIYGLGFLLLAVAIGVPVIVLLSIFPALLPFAVIGFVVYWFWWRKRTKAAATALPKA